jgi:alpha-1,2-mannosyltransferase
MGVGNARRTLGQVFLAGGRQRVLSAGRAPCDATAIAAHEPKARWLITLSVVGFATSVALLIVLDAASSSQRWFMLDLQIYRWGGLLALRSGNLYSAHFPHHHLHFTYPPIAALIFAALSAISLPILRWVVTVGSIAALTITLWLTWGCLGYRRPACRIAAALAATGVALWLQPVQQTMSFGQVNLILMLIIVADFCPQRTAWPRGIGIGLAAGLKLTPLIFIPYLLLTRQFRAAGVAGVTFVLTIAGSLILLPSQSHTYWLEGLFLNSHRVGNIAYVGNQSLNGALARLAGSVPAVHLYWLICSVVIGAAGLLLATWAARRGQQMVGILTCALTGLLISPVSWSHHWVWAAPALVVATDLAIRNGARQVAGGGQSLSWRRLAGWIGVAVLAAPFFALPQGLVAAAAVQGNGGNSLDLIAGDLYIIVGLTLLSFPLLHRRWSRISLNPDRLEIAQATK